MFNNKEKVRISDEEAEPLIRANKLKPLCTITEDGKVESDLTADERAVIYGEVIWHERNNPQPYKMLVKDRPKKS